MSHSEPFQEDQFKRIKEPWDSLRAQVERVFIGMPEVVEKVCICLLCGGHMLLEGVPGTAKTHLLKVVARLLGLSFARVQFTPDLLPSDLVGTLIYNPRDHSFEPKMGPIMTHFLLADEINRAPAKVQSALLEAMAENQVTVGDKSYPLPQPFFVCASQNPIEQEGTFYLPEAQRDRFLFKIHLGYLSMADECKLLGLIDRLSSVTDQLKPVLSALDILNHQKAMEQIYVDSKLAEYMVRLVHASRETKVSLGSELLDLGGGPRASIGLYKGARARAFLRGRHFVVPEDVIEIAHDVFGHRVLLSVHAEVQGLKTRDVVEKLLERIPQP
jgi:MoxR-like ATPase